MKIKQINTWNQYKRWLKRANLGWHVQSQRFAHWPLYGESTGIFNAESHSCARAAMKSNGVRFGRAMRRWLAETKTEFPPGWTGPRELRLLKYL